MVDYNYLFAVISAGIAIVLIVLSKQWFITGIKIWFGNIRFKGNAGAIFFRTVGSDFSPPIIIDLRTDKFSDKKRTVIYSREMFSQGRFMGVPYCFKDSEDDKTSLGIHKQQTDTNGKALSIVVELGEGENKQTVVQPLIAPIKDSVSLSPELLTSSINAIALTQTVKDFIEKNKTLLLVAGASAIAGCAGAYFGYSNNQLLYDICKDGISQLSGQITAFQLNMTGGM
jgi:hypothetical protein